MPRFTIAELAAVAARALANAGAGAAMATATARALVYADAQGSRRTAYRGSANIQRTLRTVAPMEPRFRRSRAKGAAPY